MVRVPRLRTVRVASMLAVVLVPTMLFLLLPVAAYAQHEGHLPPPPAGLESNLVLNGIEIITGLAAAAVAFQAALAYREGRLGKAGGSLAHRMPWQASLKDQGPETFPFSSLSHTMSSPRDVWLPNPYSRDRLHVIPGDSDAEGRSRPGLFQAF